MISPGNRTIRVFVSSTFRDMQEERDLLVKFVFPKLRKLCGSRGVAWGEVDLRWGITAQQSEEGQVLPLCLEEIRRCRPFFIGLLAERYGSLPRNIPAGLLEREPWLADHLDRSVTELEMIHGVLRDPQMKGHAYFYFRDPFYFDRKLESAGGALDAEPPDKKEKLARLKQRIRGARDARDCHLREPYRNPQELADWVLQDFTYLVDALFPESQKPNPLDQEAADHHVFADSRSGVYIGRQESFARLDAHANGSDPPLVILGESGSGKSALLANWAAQYRAAHPGSLILMHFVGATPFSADWAAILRRLLGELKRNFQIMEEIPREPEQLAATFANWLHMAAVRGRVIIILDALNQLEDRAGAQDLIWLPSSIPENVRLFLSTLAGRSLDELEKRGWPRFQVQPLSPEERLQLISEYLAQYSKALDKKVVARIVSAPQTANPLYLRVLLDELRVFGSHQELDDRISFYLAAAAVPELYQKVLSRWESDYSAGKDLVRNTMTLLWASRHGLMESELVQLLGSDDSPLPSALWSPLYLAADQALVNRSGLLNFGHEYLRDAVLAKYLATENHQRSAHHRLAQYFGRHELGPRKIDELPWQLSEAREWPQLLDLLRSRNFLPSAWDQSDFEVQAHWARMQANSTHRMVDAYRVQIERPEAELDANFLDVIALLLNNTGHFQESMQIRSALIDFYVAAHNDAGLAVCCGSQAAILMSLGDLEGAQTAFLRQEQICRKLGDLQGVQKSLGGQGLIAQERGELDLALRLHKEQQRICSELAYPRGVAISLNNQAMLAYEKGEFARALDLYKQEEQICRQLGDLDGLQHSLGGQANVISATGHFDGVMDLYKQQEKLCRDLGDQRGIAMNLGNQAELLAKLGNLNAAMALHKEEERLCRAVQYRRGVSVSLGNQALLLNSMGKPDEAFERLKEQEQVCRKLSIPLLLAASLTNQAAMLFDKKDFAAALDLYREIEKIYRNSRAHVRVALCLGNKAKILNNLGNISEVRAALLEQEQICRTLGNPEWLAGSLMNQVLLSRESDARRRDLLVEALRLATENGLTGLAEHIKSVERRLGSGA